MWMQRTYISGDVIEKTRFWTKGKGATRHPRKAATSERAAERNEKSAVRKMARIINCNFEDGYFVKLGMDEKRYAELEETSNGDRAVMIAEYRHQCENFLLRAKRYFKKQGQEVKAIIVVSEKDHKGHAARIHAHMIINVGSYEEINKLWKQNGKGLGWEPLYNFPDRTALAEYMLKQAARVGKGAAYIQTRNMIQPTVKEEYIDSNTEIRLPAGATELERSAYAPDAAQYVRYIRKPKIKAPKHEEVHGESLRE